MSYNLVAVIVLGAYQPGQTTDGTKIFHDIVRHPLILAVFVAIPFAALDITLPRWVMTSGDYFASLTLPLALLCIGATVSLSAIRSDSKTALGSSLFKMVILPALCTAAAWLDGFRGSEPVP